MPHWVLVDDTDPGIAYDGPWFADHGSQNNLGTFGIPYQSTLHGTNSSANFSYTFQGTRVLITGTLQFSNPPTSVTSPTWECRVDNVLAPVQTYTTPANRLLFCEQDGLSDGSHVITMTVQVSNQRTFWFDYIQYIPSPGVSLDKAALSIDLPDPAMQLGTGWSIHSPGYASSTPGQNFAYNFSGVSLTWFGFYDNSLPLAATTATYAIDGQPPISFNLNGLAASATGVQFNQIFFQTPQLTAGQHTIEVAYQGNSQTAPLTISSLIVQNGTGSILPSASPSVVVPSGTAAPIASKKMNDHRTAIIVGGVIGLLALVLAAILVYAFLYRSRRRPKSKIDLAEEPPLLAPPTKVVSPFNILNGSTSSSSGRNPRPGYRSKSSAQVGSHSAVAMSPIMNEKARLLAYHSSSSRLLPQTGGSQPSYADNGSSEPQTPPLPPPSTPDTRANGHSSGVMRNEAGDTASYVGHETQPPAYSVG